MSEKTKKTLRRRHYGIPDDDYLFLKIMDESLSHRRIIEPYLYLDYYVRKSAHFKGR